MPNLDDPQTYVDLDPSGMAGRLSDVPRQCLQGWRQATSLELPGLSGPFDRVVIAGMGGSAIAGDLVADLASLQGRLPVTVVREFEIPFSLNPQTLMIACSYSGNTQETLAMFRHGLDMGATVMAATAGGTLAREAAERGVPTLFVDVEGEPRNAAVYNFTLSAWASESFRTSEHGRPRTSKRQRARLRCGWRRFLRMFRLETILPNSWRWNCWTVFRWSAPGESFEEWPDDGSPNSTRTPKFGPSVKRSLSCCTTRWKPLAAGRKAGMRQ